MANKSVKDIFAEGERIRRQGYKNAYRRKSKEELEDEADTCRMMLSYNPEDSWYKESLELIEEVLAEKGGEETETVLENGGKVELLETVCGVFHMAQSLHFTLKTDQSVKRYFCFFQIDVVGFQTDVDKWIVNM